MKRHLCVLIAVLLAGCAAGPRIPLDLNSHPTTEYGWHIAAEDLMNPDTASSRLSVYLDELIAAGYKREIRIALTPELGPFMEHYWLPVIRAKGFHLLAFLGNERRDSADMPHQAQVWAEHILPEIRDILVGVQVVNEQARVFSSDDYRAWHRTMVPVIRAVAPGVPIIAGDFGQFDGVNGLNQWEAMVRSGFTAGQDFDIVSLHLTGADNETALVDMIHRLFALHGQQQEYWVTEGDWGHLPWLRDHGLSVTREFVYSWNAPDQYVRRPGGILP